VNYRIISPFIDVYRCREVLFNMVSQHLKVKYRRTYFGYLWSLLNPILQLTVLTMVFSHVVRLNMKDYILYLFSGLVVWNFLSACIQQGGVAILENEHFIKTIYIPKLIFPLAKMILAAVDFFSSLVALTVIGLFLGLKFPVTMALLPLAVVPMFAFCFGVLLLVCVGTVYFRDIQYLSAVFLQLFYFLTPIIYPFDMIPPQFQQVLKLNPILYEVVPFQKLIYYGQIPSVAEWGAAYGVGFLFLLGGLTTLLVFEDELIFRM